MPRLQVIDPATATGEVKETFDGPLKGMHLNIFKGMGNSPVGLNAYLGLAGATKGGELSDQEREAIALYLAETRSCDYCTAAHTMIGKNAGLSEDQTVSARKGESTGHARIDAIVAFTKAIEDKKGFVDDADLDAFKAAGFNDGHVVEVIANYALNTYTNIFNHINQTEVDLPAVPALA